jgi:hypothetical protein
MFSVTAFGKLLNGFQTIMGKYGVPGFPVPSLGIMWAKEVGIKELLSRSIWFIPQSSSLSPLITHLVLIVVDGPKVLGTALWD